MITLCTEDGEEKMTFREVKHCTVVHYPALWYNTLHCGTIPCTVVHYVLCTVIYYTAP